MFLCTLMKIFRFPMLSNFHQKIANMLASNPVSANEIFHRRIKSIYGNFLFRKINTFGDIKAFLGRIENQSRHSPHIHLLIWLENGPSSVQKNGQYSMEELIDYIEIFSTALQSNGPLLELENIIEILDTPDQIPQNVSNMSNRSIYKLT